MSKNFPYNKPKPSNKLSSAYSILKKKSDEDKNLINSKNQNQFGGETLKTNTNYNDDAISVNSFNNINSMNNNMLMNSPRTTASFMTEIDNNNINNVNNLNNNNFNNNNFIRNTQQNRYFKISISPNRNINMNRTSYNYYNQSNISNNKLAFNNKINNNINNYK